MKRPNIYKMDDILLFLSLAMVGLLVFISWDWLRLFPETDNFTSLFVSAPEVLGAKFYTVVMYALAAVFAQIIGRYIRFLEKKSHLILDELEISSKIRITDLYMKLGMSETAVKKLVLKLSRVPSLGISFDGERVIRRRVSVKTKNIKPDTLKTEKVRDVSENSEKKGPPILLLIFLFFTPLWPLAIFLIFKSSMKNMQRTDEES